MITKYGYSSLLRLFTLCLIIAILSFIFIEADILKTFLITVASLLFLFVLLFFRDPERHPPEGENLILSPADGTVVDVQRVREEKFLHSDATQISIFLSPLDVHVNRIPVSGRIRHLEYVNGEYLVAFHEKASEKNERTLIGIENGKFKILMRQIAGFIARRIVCDLQPGVDVRAGERFGMIKFGSRVDVLVPINSELMVHLRDRVVAGETILARVFA
jgi:phosphatidylserine decarboxylase